MRPAIRVSQRFIICAEIIDGKTKVKYLPHILITLLIAIQYPLWIGKGSWLRVWDMSKQVDQQKEKNVTLASRNAGLDAEVRDLKQGIDAVEERARVEFGMVKSDETFYQIIEKSKQKL
jgi:cell division protein FtsB